MNNLDNMEIMITGGTGSLGKTLVKLLKTNYNTRGIRIYSRDEFKQFHFKKELQSLNLDKNVAFIIGDIRDEKSLTRAMKKVDFVIHTAALKQIQACNENPMEAVATNVIGTQNVITAAMKNSVSKVMFVSTDKACECTNLYGATKQVAEKLCLYANIYHSTRFSCCRYGNVLGSRGSIVPLFREQAKQGKITITHKDMTRFWIRLSEVAYFLLNRLKDMKGGEIFVPKMMVAKVIDIAKAICPDCKIIYTRPNPGEKLQETLITQMESRSTIDCGKYFKIITDYTGDPINDFVYDSDPEKSWASPGLKKILEIVE